MAADATFKRGRVFVEVYGGTFRIRREYYPPEENKDYSYYLQFKDIKNLRFILDKLEAMSEQKPKK